MEEKIIVINTDQASPAKDYDNVYQNRDMMWRSAAENCGIRKAEVDLFITAFGRLEKTRECVESVLRNTNDVDYNLILIDHGSCDGTFEYFKSIDYRYKTIIRITKNVGASLWSLPEVKKCQCYGSEYFLALPNDVTVTKHWLRNMLRCMESDSRIGIVVPCSSNVSNLQDPGLEFRDYDTLQAAAARFNVSDPFKWHERLRVITLGTLCRKSCLLAIGEYMDSGFIHDFGDDDVSFRVRRGGYKVMLCCDTFVHHNHDALHGEGKDLGTYHRSLEKGRQDFRQKYFGIDAWDDVNNYERPMIQMLQKMPGCGGLQILGIDVKCGTPLLEAKNRLKELYRTFDVTLSAFTEEAKYYLDLKTICGGQVENDRAEYISEYFVGNMFDCIVLGKPLNLYSEPMKLLLDILKLLNADGQAVIKLRNTMGAVSLFHMLGSRNLCDSEYPLSWTLDDISGWVSRLGFRVKGIAAEKYTLSKADLDAVNDFCRKNKIDPEGKNRLTVKDYILRMTK